MKKRIFMCATAIFLSLAAMAQGGKYTLNGTISNADGQKIYLRYGSDQQSNLDSAVVKKGKFAFKGTLTKPFEQALLYMGSLEGYGNTKIARFALEPAKLTAVIDANNFDDAVIHGGKTQEENNQFEATLADVNKKLKELSDAYYKATGAEREALKAQMEPYTAKAKEARDQFIKTHPDSYLTPQFLLYSMGNMSYAELKGIYDGLSDNVKKYGRCDDIVKEIEALERVQVGKTAPDFTATDINGQSFTLSSLRGKVVIIDFWASWCVPCRKSNPHMLELYEKYHDRGLDMVYVSDDDSNPAAWRKAVEKDGLTAEGFHHVLRGLKWDRSQGIRGIDHTNDISDKYAIHYLPTKYLIDQQGHIVCKINEGEDEKLEQQLERLLGKAEYPFTINGSIAKAEGKQVQLAYGSRENAKQLTTVVKDGKFQLSGVIDSPCSFAQLILGEWDPRTGGDACGLALEKGTFTVDAPTGKFAKAVVKGGKAQDDMNEYQAGLEPIEKSLSDLNRKYESAKTDKQREDIRGKMEPLIKQYGDYARNYMQTHPDSYMSAQNLEMIMSEMSYEEIKKTFEGFSQNVQNNAPSSKAVKKELKALASTQPGSEAPDFTAKDINGNDFTFSSLRGKVVIIDFWASWCVPCRKSNPHMLELYKKYHDRGLDMVYVSDDDSNPDAWRKAVEKDGLTGEGFHHVLRGFKMDRTTGIMDTTNDISSKYAVHLLPTKYLIDKQGNIVCRIDEGEDAKIEQLIESLF